MEIKKWLENENIVIKDEELIKQAFIHTSYVNENKKFSDNERLEFMGDAVIQIWVSEKLFNLVPTLKEGQMTTLRARLVCEKALSIYAKELGLNKFILLGSGEEKNGGRNKDSIVSDMFEAFIGAIYIDSGFEAVNKILNKVIPQRINNPDEIEVNIDYKTKLQEYVQGDIRKTVTYEVVSVSGPSNSPEFEVIVVLDNITLGRGKGNSKKKAEQNAAKNAFETMAK